MRCVPVLAIVLVVVVDFNQAAPPEGKPAPSEGKGRKLGLTKEDKDAIQANCEKSETKCKGQTEEDKQSRKDLKDALVGNLKERGHSDEEAEQKIEEQLSKVQELKKKWYEVNGLGDIEPVDDGVLEGDILITAEEADGLIKELANPTPADRRKKRGASIFFEGFPEKNWTMPIHYWISTYFTDHEKSVIRDALATITAAASCITFVEDAAALASGAQIQYQKRAGLVCDGGSYIGLIAPSINVITLQTSCGGDDVKMKGIFMHETMHSLGRPHEQSREDRDYYITILWSNINSMYASSYAIFNLGLSTSYGVPYDYYSRMHYKQGTFAIDPSKPTMQPLDNSVTTLGGNVLTAGDITELKRMYCAKPCVDTDPDCGWIATAAANYCASDAWTIQNCKKSCGVCG